MKIAISASGPNSNAQVDLRFGRCRNFALADEKTDDFEFIDNDAVMAGSGAGVQTAQMLADAGVEVVITGNIGPNAISVLKTAGIRAYHCGPGTVRSAFQKYREGKLQETAGYKVGSESGGGGFNRGIGRGKGRGRGGGKGRT